MDYTARLNALNALRRGKLKEYKKALSKYMEPNQNAITFKEVNDLKEELDDIHTMITAIKNTFNPTSGEMKQKSLSNHREA